MVQSLWLYMSTQMKNAVVSIALPSFLKGKKKTANRKHQIKALESHLLIFLACLLRFFSISGCFCFCFFLFAFCRLLLPVSIPSNLEKQKANGKKKTAKIKDAHSSIHQLSLVLFLKNKRQTENGNCESTSCPFLFSFCFLPFASPTSIPSKSGLSFQL